MDLTPVNFSAIVNEDKRNILNDVFRYLQLENISDGLDQIRNYFNYNGIDAVDFLTTSEARECLHPDTYWLFHKTNILDYNVYLSLQNPAEIASYLNKILHSQNKLLYQIGYDIIIYIFYEANNLKFDNRYILQDIIDNLCFQYAYDINTNNQSHFDMTLINRSDISYLLKIINITSFSNIDVKIKKDWQLHQICRLMSCYIEDQADLRFDSQQTIGMTNDPIVTLLKQLFPGVLLQSLARCLSTPNTSPLDMSSVALARKYTSPCCQPVITAILARAYFSPNSPTGNSSSATSVSGETDSIPIPEPWKISPRDILKLANDISYVAIAERCQAQLHRASCLIQIVGDMELLKLWLEGVLGPVNATNTGSDNVDISKFANTNTYDPCPLNTEYIAVTHADQVFVIYSLLELIFIQPLAVLRAVFNAVKARRPICKEEVEIFKKSARARIHLLEEGPMINRDIHFRGDDFDDADLVIPDISVDNIRSWANTYSQTGQLPNSAGMRIRMLGRKGAFGIMKAMKQLISSNPAGQSTNHTAGETVKSLRKCCADVVQAMAETQPPFCSQRDVDVFKAELSKGGGLNLSHSELLKPLQLSASAGQLAARCLGLLSTVCEHVIVGCICNEEECEGIIHEWRVTCRELFTDINRGVVVSTNQSCDKETDNDNKGRASASQSLKLAGLLASSLATTLDSIAAAIAAVGNGERKLISTALSPPNSVDLCTTAADAATTVISSTTTASADAATINTTATTTAASASRSPPPDQVQTFIQVWLRCALGLASVTEGWTSSSDNGKGHSHNLGLLGASVTAVILHRTRSLEGAGDGNIAGTALLLNVLPEQVCFQVLELLLKGMNDSDIRPQSLLQIYPMLKCAVLWTLLFDEGVDNVNIQSSMLLRGIFILTLESIGSHGKVYGANLDVYKDGLQVINRIVDAVDDLSVMDHAKSHPHNNDDIVADIVSVMNKFSGVIVNICRIFSILLAVKNSTQFFDTNCTEQRFMKTHANKLSNDTNEANNSFINIWKLLLMWCTGRRRFASEGRSGYTETTMHSEASAVDDMQAAARSFMATYTNCCLKVQESVECDFDETLEALTYGLCVQLPPDWLLSATALWINDAVMNNFGTSVRDNRRDALSKRIVKLVLGFIWTPSKSMSVQDELRRAGGWIQRKRAKKAEDVTSILT